tara:strand:+ start:5395 stop:16407 length:11013 start_codon:yes stop_codon:yes gene_type:complete
MANSKFKQLILGNSVKQDNRTYPPTMGSTPAAFDAPAGMAIMSADEAYNPGVAYAEGDLLFYTDGATVYDSTGAIMNSGTLNGLGGEKKLAQPAVILKSSETHYYWILTLDASAGRIYVSTVLMTGNSGRGAVTQKQTITVGGAGVAYITQGAATSDRFNAFYSTSTSQYGIMTHTVGSNRWISHVITGVVSHLPVFAALVSTPIGSTYANNDAANHATIKFNEENTKMATVYQASVGTSGTPVVGATVEVYTLNPTTGVPSAFTSFIVPIRDAGAVVPAKGNDGRLKGYDLEWDFDTDTLYVPAYDGSLGLGINYYTVNASNVVTATGAVSKSFNGIGSSPDKAIFGMYKDPYEDRIYVNRPAVVGTTGGYSSDYNDTYATNEVDVIKDTATPSSSEFNNAVATTIPGDTIGIGTPTRPMAGEEVGASSYYTLTPCGAQREYIMDTLGSIWVLNGALDATKIADVSTIANRVNIAVQKETNFIYLLAGTGATPKVYKIDPVTGTVDAGTTVSGTSITGFKSISSKDGDAAKLYAVIEISGPNYNYAEIVIATGVATKTAGNTSHVAVDTAYIGSTLYMASGDDLYKNTGPGTWATVGANGLTKTYEGLSTDDTTLYGYIESKRYTINTSTGAATDGKSITIGSGANTWNYTAQGAGIVNIATLTTNDTNPSSYLDQVITVTNYAGCYTITIAGSGSTVIGDILSHYDDCGSCNDINSINDCKLLVSCCDSGYKGLGFTREIIGTTDDVSIGVGNTYEITGGNQTTDQLNRCVTVENTDDSLYIVFANKDGYSIDITTGVITHNSSITSGTDIAFNKHSVGFISTSSNGLNYYIPSGAYGSTGIAVPQHSAMSFNYSDELITGGVVSGVTQVSRNTIDKKGVLTTVNTLTNTTVQLTGDLAVDKTTGNYYCLGDSSPTSVPETNDLFKLDPSTLTHTVIASLTSTLSLQTYQKVTGIDIAKDICYVLVWDSRTFGLTLYSITKDTGVLVSTLSLQDSDGETKFIDIPTGLAYNNPCPYWTPAAFQVTSYTSCTECYASSTSKNCCYELIDCVTGHSVISSTELSAYVGKIIVIDDPGKCYTVYTYDNSTTCTGVEVSVNAQYNECSDCTPIQGICYRLLKCDDPTSDPKYTSKALTPHIKARVGKTVVLEGETFCRNVDDQGNAVELTSATALNIKHVRPSCTKCKFFLKLKQCGKGSVVRYVDYGSNPGLHPWIGTGAVRIGDLGNDENENCWTIDSKILGPSTTIHPTVSLTQATTSCTSCSASDSTYGSSAPSTYKMTDCCGNADHYTVHEDVVAEYQMIQEFENGDPFVIWGTVIDVNGNSITGCWSITQTSQPVAPQFLAQDVQMAGSNLQVDPATGETLLELCDACGLGVGQDTDLYTDCTPGSFDTTELLNCDPTIANQYVYTNSFDNYTVGNYIIYSFGNPALSGCWRKCTTADHIHGVNWFWGFKSGLKWNLLSSPDVQYEGQSSMGLTDDQLNDNHRYTKFGSTVHSAHEHFTTIADITYEKGDLMFYSDGRFVFNSNHLPMAGSTDPVTGVQLLTGGVNPDASAKQYASQQCITVPKPDSEKFLGYNTYKEYYLFYQKPGSLMFQYAVINMDTADGLGEIISYNQDVPLQPLMAATSSERLAVSSRQSVSPATPDVYYLVDIGLATTLGAISSGSIRRWRIDINGINMPTSTDLITTNSIAGEMSSQSPNLSQWGRIKIHPSNRYTAITGNNNGRPWTLVYKGPGDDGTFTFVEERNWAGNILANNCVTTDPSWEADFIPYTHAVEWGDTALFTYKSGMSYPPSSWTCDLYEYQEQAGSNLPYYFAYPPPKAKLYWQVINGADDGLEDTTQGVIAEHHSDHTLPSEKLREDCEGLTCEECQEQDFPGVNSIWNQYAIGTSHKVSNPSILWPEAPIVVPTGNTAFPSPFTPMLQASIITDLHMGPDQHLYAGIVLGQSTGAGSNFTNWHDTFLHIGERTPEYLYNTAGVGIDGTQSTWTPDPMGNSQQRVAATAALQKFRISDIPFPTQWGTQLLGAGTNVPQACQTAWLSRSVPINGVIDFGFPQYLKRQCVPMANLAEGSNGILNVYPDCADEGALYHCGFPQVEGPTFKISNCASGDCSQADADSCLSFEPGIIYQQDGVTSRFGVVHSGLHPLLYAAINDLPLGPQTIDFTYSFIKAGSTVKQAGSWAGDYTIGELESGPGTSHATGCSFFGNEYDKTYTVTETEFKDDVGKCFTEIKKIFEGVFSEAGGYPNQLTVNFTALVNASGDREETNVDDDVFNGYSTSTVNTSTWSSVTPIGFELDNGCKGVGDFRIMMGRYPNKFADGTGTSCSTCTNCTEAGGASGYLAWASGPGPSNVPGLEGAADGTAYRMMQGYQMLTFDVNEDWRGANDPQLSNTFDIVMVAAHELMHAMGFHHSYDNISDVPGCSGPPSAWGAEWVDLANCAANAGYGAYNNTCPLTQVNQDTGADDCLMGPFATYASWTELYGDQSGSNYDPTACYQMSNTTWAKQDRAMVCQIYGYNYFDSQSMCIAEYCPDCVSTYWYSQDPLFYDYLPTGSFTWNPGSGLGCYEVELLSELPPDLNLTSITPVTDYENCTTCEVQFLPPRYRFILCDECNASTGADNFLITSDSQFEFYFNTCSIAANVDSNNYLTPIFTFTGYLGCYQLDCGYDPYENYENNPIVSLPILNTDSESCDTCCTDPTQCWSITQCVDVPGAVGITVIVDDMYLQAYQGYTVKFVALPQSMLDLGLTTEDCFFVDFCGVCDTTGCVPTVSTGILQVLSQFDTCYACNFDPTQACAQLICCSDNSGDVLDFVQMTVDLQIAFNTGQIVKIVQFPDANGNPRCWHVTPIPNCIPNTGVVVLETIASCTLCVDNPDIEGCMDSGALNYCPGCTIPCDDCCIYVGCGLNCLEPTATNYNPNASCDCAGVAGGTSYTCCEYPAVIVPPVGVTPTFEKDCVNCLDWLTVDALFEKTATMCDVCFPPKGLTRKEYDCSLTTQGGYIIPPETAIPGCTDPSADNFSDTAEWDDGTCVYGYTGCTDTAACNFNQDAIVSDISQCIYPNECGCYDNSCFGCTNPLACNYDPTATVDDGNCDTTSCYGCMDPAADNYDENALYPCTDGCCVTDVEQCFDNRNIYVFFDTTSMNPVDGVGYTNQDEMIAGCNQLKSTFNQALDLLIAEIPNFSGNVYYMGIGVSYGAAVAQTQWRNNTYEGATWEDYKVWDGTAGTSVSGTHTYSGNLGASPVHTASGWQDYFGTTTQPWDDAAIPGFEDYQGGSGSQTFGNKTNERWVSWFEYPIHGNSTKLNPNNRLKFTNVINKNKTTGVEEDYGNWTVEVSSPLNKAFMANGIDGNGQYINGLPGIQVNPFNDPPGEEGFSDVYHEFEGGDTNCICIAFIDESSGMYTNVTNAYQYDEPDCDQFCPTADCAFDVQDGTVGPGSSLQNPENNKLWAYSNCAQADSLIELYGYLTNVATKAYIWDVMSFSAAWKWGYDLTGEKYTILEPNGDQSNSYQSGNFNAILFPTQISGSSQIGASNSALIRLAYAGIGQGFNVSDDGIIPVEDFSDLPYAASSFSGCSNTDTGGAFFSMKRLTDSNIGGANGLIADPNYPESNGTMKMTNNTQSVSPGHYMSAGKSLSRYGVQFRLPGGEISLTQAGPQEIFEALLAGLNCDYNG